MQGYRTVRTSKNSYKFIKKQEEYSTLVKVSNFLWPYIVAILAGYGFIDLLLTANGI